MSGIERRPYLVSWNLTRRCNLACPHCYIDAQTETDGELTSGEVRSVIDELASLNNRLMLILSGGEPMLRGDIFDIVAYAAKSGLITVMGSNGTLLSGERLKLLKEAGLKGIGISIDATVPGKHDSLRGGADAWRRSVQALDEAKGMGTETQLDVSLTDKNSGELDDFIELGVKMGVKAVNFFFLVCTGRAMRSDISTGNYERSLQRIAEVSSRERRTMVRARCAPHINRVLYENGSPPPRGTRGCLAGIHYLRIDPQGQVTPCPYMPISVGNLRERSITEIWENAPFLKLLRSGQYNGRCGVCEYREICGGCRARAGTESGDCLGEDPLCSYIPREGETLSLRDDLHLYLPWDEKAQERIGKIPIFMKGMVIRMIEAKAREQGAAIVTSELIDGLKTQHYHG